MIKQIIKTVDGNEATADVAYAFTEVATIYPITPSLPWRSMSTYGRLTEERICLASRSSW